MKLPSFILLKSDVDDVVSQAKILLNDVPKHDEFLFKDICIKSK